MGSPAARPRVSQTFSKINLSLTMFLLPAIGALLSQGVVGMKTHRDPDVWCPGCGYSKPSSEMSTFGERTIVVKPVKDKYLDWDGKCCGLGPTMIATKKSDNTIVTGVDGPRVIEAGLQPGDKILR